MNTLSFVILSVILSVTASPLGDHAVFRRHNGAQPLARRYVLESRMDIPPQCASVSGSTPTSSDPSVTNMAIPSGVTLPSDLFPTGADFTGASNAVPTAVTTDGSAIPAGPSGSRRSFIGFDFSEELSFSSFVETWETLCLSSGGDIYTNDPCSQLAGFAGINALMEFASPCDQQDIADSMITFAKSKGIKNKDSLINFALQYRKHYRNSVEILGVIPSSFYCMETPVNPELVGVYNAQISGANPSIFGSSSSPLAPFGSTGTCPLGMTADMSTCSCVSSASGSNSSDSSSDGSSSYDGSTDSAASTYSNATATDSSNVTATTTDSSNVTATATDSSNVTATATDSSNVTATATNSSNVTATATNSSNVTATATNSSNVTATATNSSNVTETAIATGSSYLASATDSSTLTATDSAAPAASATVAATNTFLTGPNVQPTDISGDVNDPAGR